MFRIIKFIKKYIDKIYYLHYTRDRETLVREMFPWINYIWEYRFIDLYLKNSTPESLDSIIKVIFTFYRWEVNRLTLEWKFQWIERYQWLLDFCQSLKDYQQYVFEEKTKNNIL